MELFTLVLRNVSRNPIANNHQLERENTSVALIVLPLIFSGSALLRLGEMYDILLNACEQ